MALVMSYIYIFFSIYMCKVQFSLFIVVVPLHCIEHLPPISKKKVVFCRTLFVIFLLTIVLSVLLRLFPLLSSKFTCIYHMEVVRTYKPTEGQSNSKQIKNKNKNKTKTIKQTNLPTNKQWSTKHY